MKSPIYLDHQATTPMDPRVWEVWQQTGRDYYGNPASGSHAYGWAAAKVVEIARERVAELIGATAAEIVFTSGATEANNLALNGVALAGEGGARDGFVSSNLEHSSVTQPLNYLATTGRWHYRLAGAQADGIVPPAVVADVTDERTLLVSLIAAQNEIGTLQPLAAVAEICRAQGALLHVDAAQAAGRLAIDVQRDQLDLVSLSAHKMYGPKGVGALYVRHQHPRVILEPILRGGGQERGLRSGTLNVPGIAAFGEAARIALSEREAENTRLAAWRDQMWRALQAALDEVHLNGHPTRRLSGNLNVSFGGVPAGRLLAALPGLALSSGAACTSTTDQSSPVLEALGVSPKLAAATLRIGLGRFTTAEEVALATEKIIAGVRRLRSGG